LYWDRIPAVDGRSLDRSKVKLDAYRSLKKGEIGAWLSHRRAMATISTVGIICEDDANITPEFWPEYFRVLKTAPKDWDILAFGATRLWRKKYQHLGKLVSVNDDWDQVNGHLYGCHCYLINKRAVDKFLSDDTMRAPPDVDIFMKNKTYLVKHDIATQLRLGSTTQNLKNN